MILYKYLTTERLDVLRNREIRFTQPAALNDPFELNPFFDTLITKPNLEAEVVSTPLDLATPLTELYEKLPPDQKKKIPLDAVIYLGPQPTMAPLGYPRCADADYVAMRVARMLLAGMPPTVKERLANDCEAARR